MSTFALIHGGGHGGWCWELVIPELEARASSAVAPDLPIDDPGPGLAAYAQIVVRAIGDSVDDVVVVGHSLGGLVVPLVAGGATRAAYDLSRKLRPGSWRGATARSLPANQMPCRPTRRLLPTTSAASVPPGPGSMRGRSSTPMSTKIWLDARGSAFDLRAQRCFGSPAPCDGGPTRLRHTSSWRTIARSTPAGVGGWPGSVSASSQSNCPAATHRSCRGLPTLRVYWIRWRPMTSEAHLIVLGPAARRTHRNG